MDYFDFKQGRLYCEDVDVNLIADADSAARSRPARRPRNMAMAVPLAPKPSMAVLMMR